jgi:hypothetical protein
MFFLKDGELYFKSPTASVFFSLRVLCCAIHLLKEIRWDAYLIVVLVVYT